MENTNTTADALRHRLRVKLENLVSTYEALPEPETYAEAQRSARALMAIEKAITILCPEGEGGTVNPPSQAFAMPLSGIAPIEIPDHLFETLRPGFERRLETLACEWWERGIKGAAANTNGSS